MYADTGFIRDGLGAIDAPTTQLSIVTPTKPALLHAPDGSDEFQYLLMPIRTSG